MKLQYKGYTIEQGGLGFLYVHKDYEGVTYLGEDIESSDNRAGSAPTVEACKLEIDIIEEERVEYEEERSLRKLQKFMDDHGLGEEDMINDNQPNR